MGLQPRDLGRGSALGRVALARSARPGAGRVLQLRVARESGRLPDPQRDGNTGPSCSSFRWGTRSCCTDAPASARGSCCSRTSTRWRGGPPTEKGSQATWAFYVLDGGGGSTRLLERGCGVAGKGLAEQLGFGPYLMDPIGFVMSKKMLRTIKRLAEASER